MAIRCICVNTRTEEMHVLQFVSCGLFGFCCIASISGKPCSDESRYIDGYYWRRYDGVVPPDALLGGTDAVGNPTYIGQVVFKGVLIPGQIDPEEKAISFEWGNAEHKQSSNIKILCTKQPEQFEWIRTTNEQFPNLQNDTFIYGGFESTYTIFIGRVFDKKELLIGKVLIINGECKGLHTSNNGKFIRNSSFEILNYNPDIPNKYEIREALAGRSLYELSSASILESCVFSLIMLLTALCLM